METLFNLKRSPDESSKSPHVKQAENIWSMLDEMAMSNPESYKKFIEKTIQEGKEAMKPPDAHMCVKTTLIKPNTRDLYVNFFSWFKVSAPKTDEDPIPIYGSKLVSHQTYSIINLVFNTEVLDKYGRNSSNKVERNMLINLAFEYVESLNQVKINKSKFELLEDSKYYGDLGEHILLLTNKKLSEQTDQISELEMARAALGDQKHIPDTILNKLNNLTIRNDTKSEASSNVSKNVSKPLIEELIEVPSYKENFLMSKDGNQVYELKIHLPKISSMSECNLDIDDQYLRLDTTTNCYKELNISLLDLNKKYKFSPEVVDAKFIKKTCLLKVKIPLIPIDC